MKYIAHKPYRKIGASGRKFFIKKGKEFETVGNFIADGSEAICSVSSQDAYEHFARNDDGNGMERGRLTFNIAFKSRTPNKENSFRFTPEEIEMIETEYPQWIRKDADTILFNYDFFNAEVDKLKTLHEKLRKEVI